jgi:hypothetical protein
MDNKERQLWGEDWTAKNTLSIYSEGEGNMSQGIMYVEGITWSTMSL